VLQSPHVVNANMTVLDLLISFQQKTGMTTALICEEDAVIKEGRYHTVSDFVIDKTISKNKPIIGLVSLKDIFEKICDRKIQD